MTGLDKIEAPAATRQKLADLKAWAHPISNLETPRATLAWVLMIDFQNPSSSQVLQDGVKELDGLAATLHKRVLEMAQTWSANRNPPLAITLGANPFFRA